MHAEAVGDRKPEVPDGRLCQRSSGRTEEQGLWRLGRTYTTPPGIMANSLTRCLLQYSSASGAPERGAPGRSMLSTPSTVQLLNCFLPSSLGVMEAVEAGGEREGGVRAQWKRTAGPLLSQPAAARSFLCGSLRLEPRLRCARRSHSTQSTPRGVSSACAPERSVRCVGCGVRYWIGTRSAHHSVSGALCKAWATAAAARGGGTWVRGQQLAS